MDAGGRSPSGLSTGTKLMRLIPHWAPPVAILLCAEQPRSAVHRVTRPLAEPQEQIVDHWAVADAEG